MPGNQPKTTLTGFPVEETETLKRFFVSCTVPLIYLTDVGAQVHGTGTFFEYCDRPFLISAAHVFDGIDANRLGVPERSGSNVDVRSIGHCNIYFPKQFNGPEDLDAAIVELLDEDFVSTVRRGWHFLKAENVALPKSKFDGYVIAAYPLETVNFEGGVLTPTELTQLYTGVFDGEIDGTRSEHDLFLRYGKEAQTALGVQRETPHLGGASGAAVFGRVNFSGGVWSPESVLRVVGIQVAAKHSEYVRVKSWELVQHILHLITSRQQTAL